MEIRSPHFTSVILIVFVLSLLFGVQVRSEDAGWIDTPTASSVLPYAYMSQDAYSADARPLAGWTRIADWKTIFSRGGLSADIITSADKAGFSAALYRNNATGELTIAYRGTQGLAGWGANIEAGVGTVPGQYHFAAALATLVKTQYPKAPSITATGHSLGGALATYASQQSPGITKVLTFNSARPPIVSSVTSGRGTQINVVVPGEVVGDPNTKSDVGLGSLPGKTYSVQSTTENPGALGIVATHKLEGVIGGLEAVKSVRADSLGGTSSNVPSGSSTGSPGPAAGPAQQPSQSPSSRPEVTASRIPSTPSGASAPLYSFKPLANGNVEIYENGKPISTGSGFTLSYARSLGYLPPLPQQTATAPSGASGSVPAVSSPSVQPPNAPASGAIPSTNPNLQMYSFKSLANGNVEIYENGKPISTGSGFSVSYAQSLGYSPPPSTPAPTPTLKPSQNLASSTVTVTAPSKPVPQSETIGTPASSATAVDVGRSAPLPEVIAHPLYNTAPKTAISPSVASSSVPTGSSPSVQSPNVPASGPVQSTNLPSQPIAVSPSAKPPSSVGPTVQAPQQNTQIASRSPASNASVSSPSISSAPAPTAQGIAAVPGGVSLSRAAAERMPFEITLDASALSDGKIVLSGRASKTRMDAALFLTTLRAACDDRDPYFSLDPDNGALWSEQGDQASNVFWEKIKKDFPPDAPARAKNAQSGVNIRTVSATRDYPGMWHDISPHYPNFRSKLVFYPEWLRQTRLGEVLYKADVLLKELSSGVSILVPGKLRASAIPGYLSSDIEYTAKSLLAGTRDQTALRPQWRGSRLWFDIAPSASPTSSIIGTAAPSSSGDSQLRSLLTSNKFIRSNDQAVQDASFIVRHDNSFDLSQVTPRMFVRVHDLATNKDLSDHDPRLDGLATDVSTRFDQYAQYYDELKLLRDVFRAYIAAVKIVEGNERLCRSFDAIPLLASEQVVTRLPEYHPSELFVTIGNYWTTSRKGTETQFVTSSSMSGGVSIAGQKFSKSATRNGETTVTRAVEAALAGVNLDQPDAIESDRKFISFIVDDGSGAPVRLASNARDPLAPRSLSDYPIENEPPAASRPAIERNQMLVWIVLAILGFGFAVRYRSRRGNLRGR